MKTRIPYLSETEQLVAELIADGKSYRAIAPEIPHLSERQFEHIRATLCRKAGIPHLKEPRFAREYLRNVERALNGPGPDGDQFSILAHIATKGVPFITERMQDALRSAGIFSCNPREAHTQCRAFICASGPLPQIDAKTREALQLYADGCPLPEIASLIGDPKPLKCIREGCKALHITSRGRGAQRRFVRMILARLNVVKPCDKDPLDDY